MRHVIVAVVATTALGLLGACADDPAPETNGNPPDSSQTATASSSPEESTPAEDEGEDSRRAGPPPAPRIAGTVATGLTSPWGLAFLPDGAALVAERDTARIKRIARGGAVSTVGTVPGVVPGGEGGLLGIAVSPTFERDRFVYAYYTAGDENRIVRMPYTGSRLGRPQTVLDGIPGSGIHNGGRMVFGPDGFLYVGTGEASDEPLAQDLDSLGGKILRITPDGDPAPGNPFDSPVWSYGHRNVQGLAFDDDGRLWASEFGQSTWDELNLIRPGRNYGWPEVEGVAGERGFVDPVAQWPTDEASPSGLAYADGALWMAGLRGERLWRIQIDEGRVIGKPRAFFTEDLGRLRTVAPAPGGGLWLTTSNTDGRGDPRDGDDRILRLSLDR
ncbi:PQQ-dependent sugar dehydrogenase [Actinopolymorpha sp. B9G3]|uniref:PQQ-dependent sugar dehydrogenase n=1 Tax=Actinopolymorpha sp. B9G3 TaxID=3158970 RepID=UPI0032D94C9A